MPTIGTDFEGFRQMSAEFYRACPALDSDGLDNGFKCLGLAYLGVSFAEGPRGPSSATTRRPSSCAWPARPGSLERLS